MFCLNLGCAFNNIQDQPWIFGIVAALVYLPLLGCENDVYGWNKPCYTKESCGFQSTGPQLRISQAILIALHSSISCHILGQIICLTAFKIVLIMGFYDRVMQCLFANWERKIIILECRSHLRNSFRPMGTMFPYNSMLMTLWSVMLYCVTQLF